MKITLQLKDLIYWAVIALLLWLAFRNTTPDNSAEIDRIKFQRDSVISVMIEVHQSEAKSWRRQADSSHAYIVNYERADSINKYKSRNERIKIKRLTPSERDAVRDSIYRANGIYVGPRQSNLHHTAARCFEY
jgi:hypothetical protein